PISAVPGLDKIIDLVTGESVFNPVGDEAVAVESGESFARAEPLVPPGVADNARDNVVRKAVGSGEHTARQPLRVAGCGNQQEHDEKVARASRHRALLSRVDGSRIV